MSIGFLKQGGLQKSILRVLYNGGNRLLKKISFLFILYIKRQLLSLTFLEF